MLERELNIYLPTDELTDIHTVGELAGPHRAQACRLTQSRSYLAPRCRLRPMQPLPIDSAPAGPRRRAARCAEPGAGAPSRARARPRACRARCSTRASSARARSWCSSRAGSPRAWRRGASPRSWASALGERVGYQVRFENVELARRPACASSPRACSTRRLLSDPQLRGVGAVVLDEFHERHLHGDLALALLRRLQRAQRPELRLVVMSATLDAEPVARVPRLRRWCACRGARFAGRRSSTCEQARRAPARAAGRAARAQRLVREGLDGDVLVFLPGAAEIRRAREALERARAAVDARARAAARRPAARRSRTARSRPASSAR